MTSYIFFGRTIVSGKYLYANHVNKYVRNQLVNVFLIYFMYSFSNLFWVKEQEPRRQQRKGDSNLRLKFWYIFLAENTGDQILRVLLCTVEYM